jgi:flagellar basal body rod protein FlgG
MIETYGAGLSALSAQTQRTDALANEAANVNADGYAAAMGALHVQDEMWSGLLEPREPRS